MKAKYRIKRIGENFYPQYKGLIFWSNFKHRVAAPPQDYVTGTLYVWEEVCYKNKESAEEFLRAKAKPSRPSTEIVAEYGAEDGELKRFVHYL